jgi:hypothetical protein
VYRCTPPNKGTAIHAFNALYITALKRWIRLDARGNTGGINAQFSLLEEQLAFPVNPELGELFVYNMVFTEPVQAVVDVLTCYQSCHEMWPNLLSAIRNELLCSEGQALNATL